VPGSVPPLVIAHRGASGTCPENTLVAFARAAALGAHMIELDVQLTRDGQVIVMHDWTLERTTDGAGAVRERSLTEIRRLDAGAWFGSAFRGTRVPTLAEVLAAVALPVNVELKPVGDDGLEARALAVTESAGALGRVVFSSFEAGALERLRARSAAATLAVLWDAGPVGDAMARAERVGARALHLRKDRATADAVRAAAAAGLPVRAWTVNERGEMDRLVAAGVEGVFTDFPERFLQPTTGQ
jgi:glycerophosphoryl diester phosphodiesterase